MIAWAIAAVVYVVALALPVVWLPYDQLGIRRFVSPEIAPGMTVSQIFEMTGNGLQGVRLSPTAVGQVSGNVRLELHDLTGHGDTLIRSATVPAASLVRSPTYLFEFPPIGDSKDRPYRLDVVSEDASGPHGVALQATRGAGYGGGAMVINDIGRWADLAFEVDAPAPSGLRALVGAGAGWRAARGVVVVVLFAVIWALLGVLFRALSGLWDDTGIRAGAG